jgi:hypothetical protein
VLGTEPAEERKELGERPLSRGAGEGLG